MLVAGQMLLFAAACPCCEQAAVAAEGNFTYTGESGPQSWPGALSDSRLTVFGRLLGAYPLSSKTPHCTVPCGIALLPSNSLLPWQVRELSARNLCGAHSYPAPLRRSYFLTLWLLSAWRPLHAARRHASHGAAQAALHTVCLLALATAEC